jgi:hypothetical protein
MSSKTTNLNLTKPSEDEFYDINVQNENMDIIDREINGLKQPAYEVSTAMSDLNSGEMITVAFGKIAKAVSTLISHVASKATNSVLGHVKLSDSTSSTSASTAGVAATPKAVKAAYDLANSNTKKIGTTDISGIGDGTVTGAIAENKDAIEDVTQSLANLKNPAKGTKGILVNGGSPLTKDYLLVYTLKTTKEANTGASISINGIKVCDLVTRTPNNIIEICGCVRAFKGDIITTHVASAGGYADVYAYMPNTI